jgi:hypothetical protein
LRISSCSCFPRCCSKVTTLQVRLVVVDGWLSGVNSIPTACLRCVLSPTPPSDTSPTMGATSVCTTFPAQVTASAAIWHAAVWCCFVHLEAARRRNLWLFPHINVSTCRLQPHRPYSQIARPRRRRDQGCPRCVWSKWAVSHGPIAAFLITLDPLTHCTASAHDARAGMQSSLQVSEATLPFPSPSSAYSLAFYSFQSAYAYFQILRSRAPYDSDQLLPRFFVATSRCLSIIPDCRAASRRRKDTPD